MRKILFILFSIFTIQLNAKEVKEILKQTADLFASETPVKIDFTINTKNVGDDLSHSQNGVAYMTVNKFNIDIPEATAWFDGKTQWILVKDINEVNITNPTGADLMALSPMILLSIYEQGYDVAFVGQTEKSGSQVYEISMTPQSADKNIGLIHVLVDKQTYRIKQIKINIDGLENTFLVNSYTPNVIVGENVFQFQQEKYPDAEIVDLR